MVIVGGLALAGLTAAIAVQALAPGGPPGSPSPAATSSGPLVSVAGFPPPSLDQPAALTRADQTDISGRLAGALPAGAQYRLLVYVNDRQRRDVRLDRRDAGFKVANVPLAEGTNSITVAIEGPVDATARSTPVTIERDGTEPRMELDVPDSGVVIYGASILLSGTTEGAARVVLVNNANGARATTTAGAGGEFSLLVQVRLGSQELQLTAVDQAGNMSRRKVSVVRQESMASVSLALSRDSFDLQSLPQAITIVASVAGHDGLPLDGADVTFSISAPGQMTVTRQTTTVAGSASWSGYPLTPVGAQAGRQGFVTVLVTLADGETLAASAAFSYR